MRHKRRSRPIRIPLPLQRKQLVVEPLCDLVRRRVHLVGRVVGEVDDVEVLCGVGLVGDAACGAEAAEGLLEGCGDLGFGEGGLGVVAAEEPVVQAGDDGGVEVVEARDDGDVEVLGVGRAVVDQRFVLGQAGVLGQADVPGVAAEFVEDGDLVLLEIEALQVVDY